MDNFGGMDNSGGCCLFGDIFPIPQIFATARRQDDRLAGPSLFGAKRQDIVFFLFLSSSLLDVPCLVLLTHFLVLPAVQ
jgi:hypothetical protein